MRGRFSPVCVYSDDRLAENRRFSEALGLPVLEVEARKTVPLAIIGGGESAREFHAIADKWHGDVMAINGAHDWLIEAGCVPDYHVMMDPQEIVAGFVQRPNALVRYLVASVVDPTVWRALEGCQVTMWHPDEDKVPGGPSCMTRAPVIGAMLGYREFDLYGADCSYAGSSSHVYAQPFDCPVNAMTVVCGGREFMTEPHLIVQAEYLAEMVERLPFRITVHGDGLTPALIQHGDWTDGNQHL